MAQLGWGGRGRAIPLCPGKSDVNLFGYGESVVDFDAEIPDGALNFGMAQQQLHRTQVAGSTVDECCFGTPKGVGAEKVRVEADRCNPARDKPGILPGGHAAFVITTATEQKFARFLASGFDVIVDGLPRLLRQLKPDGPTGLLLPHRCAIDRIPARCNVLDLRCVSPAISSK